MLDNSSPQNTFIGGKLSSTGYGEITVVIKYDSNGGMINVNSINFPPVINSFIISSDGTYIIFLLNDNSFF